MSTPATIEVLQRIRAEYLEMPGLALMPDQVQRLCAVDRAMCLLALDTLVESRFLSRRSNGAYGRYTDSDIIRAHPAKASLEPSTYTTRARMRSRAS